MFNKNKLEYILFTIVIKFVTLGKIDKARNAAKVLAWLLYYIFPIRKKVLLKNFNIAFPEKNAKEINELIYANYFSSALTLCEIAHLKKTTKDEIKSLVSCKNEFIINDILDEGKAVLLLTAHFGNWELGAVYFGTKLNKTVHELVKPQRNPYVTKWLSEMRSVTGNIEIPLGISIREIMKAIKGGFPIGVVGDQRAPKKSGIIVKFFGKDTFTFAGTAAIALKTNTPIVAVIVARNDDFKYEGFLEKIDIENLSGTDEEKIKQINQKYMDILEKQIRLHPEQWFWMHNIWKH
ncbi:MAG: lysophospholipid acyltransferase family protein [Melioribacteraceae bacterium]|nr:lysophospholipid acyltransferase family protein [Melioribacteraceae bacterium]